MNLVNLFSLILANNLTQYGLFSNNKLYCIQYWIRLLRQAVVKPLFTSFKFSTEKKDTNDFLSLENQCRFVVFKIWCHHFVTSWICLCSFQCENWWISYFFDYLKLDMCHSHSSFFSGCYSDPIWAKFVGWFKFHGMNCTWLSVKNSSLVRRP